MSNWDRNGTLVDFGLCNATSGSDLSDPDITGWGIIASFASTATVAFIVVIIFYVKKWLPSSQYGVFDYGVLRMARDSVIPNTDDNLAKQGAFDFIASIGDLHMAFGTALLLSTTFVLLDVGGMRGDTSVYTFQIATRLGYFSTTIHLSLLSICRPVSMDGPVPRRFFIGYYVRTGIICIFLLCMTACLFVSESVTFRFNRTVTVQCGLDHWTLVDRNREGYHKVSDEVIIYFNLVFLLWVMVIGYLKRLHWWFFPKPGPSGSMPGSRAYTLFTQLTGLSRHQMFPAGRPWKEWLASLPGLLSLLLQTGRAWLSEFEASYVREMCNLSFYLLFGFVHLFEFLRQEGVDHNIPPAFGQLVPIFLAALPLLNFMDTMIKQWNTPPPSAAQPTSPTQPISPTQAASAAGRLSSPAQAYHPPQSASPIQLASSSRTSPSPPPTSAAISPPPIHRPLRAHLGGSIHPSTPGPTSSTAMQQQHQNTSQSDDGTPHPAFVVASAMLYMILIVVWVLMYSGVISNLFILSAVPSVVYIIRDICLFAEFCHDKISSRGQASSP